MGKKKRARELEQDGLAFLTPTLESDLQLSTVDVPSGLPTFRKKILPLGSINYPMPDGTRRRVVFDRAYHRELIDAFRKDAYDAVPLQLADADNRHNMLPERTYGHVTDLSEEQEGDTDGPGLYATVRPLTADHAKLLQDNPRLGVSAQIKENRERVDGARFKAALRHILGTLDPRVVRLGDWRAISLSTDGGKVIDLTGDEYEELRMPKNKTKDRDDVDAVLSLSDEELEEALQAAADELDSITPNGDEPDLGDDYGTDLSDAGTADVYVSLSDAVEEARRETATIRAAVAADRWQTQRARYQEAGVPKWVLDLAEPTLQSADNLTLSLSDADGDEQAVDARAVITRLVRGYEGTVNLSDDVPGSGEEPPMDLSDDDAEQALLEAWDRRSGV